MYDKKNKKIEKDTGVNLKTSKVSSIVVGDTFEMLPEAVEERVKENEPDYLILQHGAAKLSSRCTGEGVSTSKIAHYRQETIVAATNLFNAAVKGLKSTQLRKVIIMKLPFHPRSSIKTFLALLFNETLTNLWIQSPHRQQILLSEGHFRKSDVTKMIIRFTKEVLKEEDEDWTLVRSKSSRFPVREPQNSFEIPTSNRFTGEGN